MILILQIAAGMPAPRTMRACSCCPPGGLQSILLSRRYSRNHNSNDSPR
jgi:hypothetical protein